MKDIVAVLLCAGKGTRMNDESTNKVCFPVNGIPAIKRSIKNMRKAGIEKFVVVVGYLAHKVMECLSNEDGVSYAFQHCQNGTGNAALMGLKVLENYGYKGAALICMGDKIISSDVISSLIDRYETSGSKCVFAVQPKSFNQGGGRILCHEDKVCGIYEQTDSYILKLGSLAEKNEHQFREALKNTPLNEKKANKVIDFALRNINALADKVVLCGTAFTHDNVEAMPYVNTATYLCDVNCCIDAIKRLNSNNAQGEIYLTDAVNVIAEEESVEIVPITAKEEMLTFATKEELKEVSNYFASVEKE